MGEEARRELEAGVLPYARCVTGGECLRCPHRGRAIAYGPFASRRRGVSIGVNPFPGRKVCSFNCVYCFRGETEVKTLGAVEDGYGVVNAGTLRGALGSAVMSVLRQAGRVDAVDFSGNGEPTLHARFPELVETVVSFVKEWGIGSSVGVFTNSSTLFRESVKGALARVDYVEAKLDAADQAKFVAVNQPVGGLEVLRVAEWLKAFRRGFGGTLAVQVMLLSYGGVSNFGDGDAEALAGLLRDVEPDVVNVCTVYREPRLSGVLRADDEAVRSFADRLRSAGLRVQAFYR